MPRWRVCVLLPLVVLLVVASEFALRHRFNLLFLQSAHAATLTGGVISANDAPDAIDDEVVTAEDTAAEPPPAHKLDDLATMPPSPVLFARLIDSARFDAARRRR